MLAQCYNSDSESDDDGNDTVKNKMPKIGTSTVHGSVNESFVSNFLFIFHTDFPIPHPDLQNIIDKTAAYVLKNGREFEDILRTKNDARFSFLSSTDEYHRYYIYKVSGVIYPTTTTPSTQTTLSNPPPIPTTIPFPSTAPKGPKVISKFIRFVSSDNVQHVFPALASVSFSIKPKDDHQAIPLKPVLPLEPSSDEDEPTNVTVLIEPINRTNATTKSVTDIVNVNIPPPTILRVNGIEPPKLLEEKLVRINHKIEMIADTSDMSIRDAMLESCGACDDKKEARRGLLQCR